jgi:WD40 repeat protein
MLVFEDKYVITGSSDGGVRLWTVNEREQTLQFYVQNQVVE